MSVPGVTPGRVRLARDAAARSAVAMRAVLRPFVPCLLLLLLAAPRPQDPQPDPAALQRAQDVGRTGAPHRVLAALVGAWDVAIETPVAGGEPRREAGTAQGRALLGGRYVELAFALRLGGQPVQGLQILGFDMLHEVYTSSWRDDLSTWAIEAAGAAVEDRPQQLALYGSLVDAAHPTGRAFRLELDLQTSDVVAMRLLGRVDEADPDAGDVVLQTQRWTKR